MKNKCDGRNGTQSEVICQSCFTTHLIFITIVLTILSIVLTLTGIYKVDYQYVAVLWFISLVMLYSVDQFIIKKIAFKRFG